MTFLYTPAMRDAARKALFKRFYDGGPAKQMVSVTTGDVADLVATAFATVVGDGDDLDAPAARLDMVRAALRGIVEGRGDAIALAKAGLDFCDLTAAERAEMRGDVES